MAVTSADLAAAYQWLMIMGIDRRAGFRDVIKCAAIGQQRHMGDAQKSAGAAVRFGIKAGEQLAIGRKTRHLAMACEPPRSAATMLTHEITAARLEQDRADTAIGMRRYRHRPAGRRIQTEATRLRIEDVQHTVRANAEPRNQRGTPGRHKRRNRRG